MRGTYVMRKNRRGKLVCVPKDRAAPLAAGPMTISDDLKADLEHHGYSDGRRTDSKSTFRRWTREAGLVEKGNDRERPKLAKTPDIRQDVATALQMCKNGYRPQIRHQGEEGWH